MTTNQTINGLPRDPCQWTDLQILDFLGVALRNVDLVGTVKLSEIRQGFEYMRNKQQAAQPQVEPVAELQVAFFERAPVATINWFTPFAFEPGATKLYTEQPAPVAVPRLEMAHVVRAHMEIPGCPVLTSNQCHALAMKLNESLNPSL